MKLVLLKTKVASQSAQQTPRLSNTRTNQGSIFCLSQSNEVKPFKLRWALDSPTTFISECWVIIGPNAILDLSHRQNVLLHIQIVLVLTNMHQCNV